MISHSWQVEGLHCTSCMAAIRKFLEKSGAKNIAINFSSHTIEVEIEKEKIVQIEDGVTNLGFPKSDPHLSLTSNTKHNHNHSHAHEHSHSHNHSHSTSILTQKNVFLISLILTLPFFFSMIYGHHHLLGKNEFISKIVSFCLATPVFIFGLLYFGKSAYQSLKIGMANMNVLILLGAGVAYFYSTYLAFFTNEHVLFFETTATIITLVLFGNFIEEWTVSKTQREVQKLIRSQNVTANVVVYNADGSEYVYTEDAKRLKVGDIILIKSGETVPSDAKILWGNGLFNDAIISGETLPISKTNNDKILGASILTDGNVRAIITEVGKDTVINHIIQMIEKAQNSKPKIQKFADKISSIFVPTIAIIGLLTFLINYFAFSTPLAESLRRSITVLVIACPCAMGLATPAAIAVGLSRGTKLGILFKETQCLEQMKSIKRVIFDKTGTLTTGVFALENYFINPAFQNIINKDLIYSIMKHSNHPIAQSIVQIWKTDKVNSFSEVTEIKGSGMRVKFKDDHIEIGSKNINIDVITKFNEEHSLYLILNNNIAGWIDIKDQIREEAYNVVTNLHKKGIETWILSGDKKTIVNDVAAKLGITNYLAEQSPQQKLLMVEKLSFEKPSIMIGDGINDAPALAKATIGASLSSASSITLNAAQLILIKNGISELPHAIRLGQETFNTIRTNLFWAFIYNILAVPIAALGLLGTFAPTVGTLIMAGSDVILFINSAWLFRKKID
ncbi:MAG: cation-translocating P-type ATPase [Sediminibacterium sp.]|nr:cation-translocating P-type ATPase [Sediminibacterium sp.]